MVPAVAFSVIGVALALPGRSDGTLSVADGARITGTRITADREPRVIRSGRCDLIAAVNGERTSTDVDGENRPIDVRSRRMRRDDRRRNVGYIAARVS
jgi:hypothetical protein